MDWTSRVSSSNVMRSSAAGADAAEPIKVNGATNAESNQRTTTQPTNDHETLYASYQHEHAGRGRVRAGSLIPEGAVASGTQEAIPGREQSSLTADRADRRARKRDRAPTRPSAAATRPATVSRSVCPPTAA